MPKFSLRHFQRLLTWLSAHHPIAKRWLIGVAIAAAATTVLQLAYPSSYTLPLVQAGSTPVGSRNVGAAVSKLGTYYRNATLTVQAGDAKITKTLAEVGIDIDTKATARAAADYPFWQRLIPFSSLVIMLSRDVPPVVQFDQERVNYFAQETAKNSFVPAKDAGITVSSNGKVMLVPAKPSQAYPAPAITHALYTITFQNRTNVRIKAVSKPAQRADNQVRAVLGSVQKIVDRPLKLALPQETVAVSKQTMVGWIDFSENAGHGLQVNVKAEAIASYVATIRARVDKAPGTTVVSIVDGKEAARTVSGDGLGIDANQTVRLIQTALISTGNASVTVPIVITPARIVYERSYSATSTGLGVLLGDVAAAKGGYGMAAIELGGLGRSASANGDKQFTSASTYKLFVAYGVFQRIKGGQMHWSDIVYGSKTAEKCFDDMIVVSDNACATALGNTVGWSSINSMMQTIGLAHTAVVPGAHLTTANDLATFLRQLQNGTLVSASDRDRLIAAMKRNIYRSGIPAGIGVTVADKVGFVDGYLNDAAIVYGPKTTYVMVILSKGSTWAHIADAAKQVHTYLQR